MQFLVIVIKSRADTAGEGIPNHQKISVGCIKRGQQDLVAQRHACFVPGIDLGSLKS
jgi:hypothetical protein